MVEDHLHKVSMIDLQQQHQRLHHIRSMEVTTHFEVTRLVD